MTLILGLLGQLNAYAEQPLSLEAKESTYSFLFSIQKPRFGPTMTRYRGPSFMVRKARPW